MASYLLICISAVLFSLQFLFQKNYKEKYGSGLDASLVFSVYVSLIGALIVFAVGFFFMGMKFNFSWFSLLLAAIISLLNISFVLLAAKAFDSANLALFSMFAMLGGMIIPFIFGAFFKSEAIDLKKIVGLILLVFALIFSATTNNDNGDKKAFNKCIFYYIGVFLVNGLVGVASSIHQMDRFSSLAVDSYMLSFSERIITFVLSLLLLAIFKKKMIRVPAKTLALTSCYSLFSTIGNLFIFIALLSLPASVQYPIITGGTIVVSNIINWIIEKKFNAKYALFSLVSLLATLMFVS